MNSALRNAYFIFSHSLNPTSNPNRFPLILSLHSLQSIAVSRLPLRIERQQQPYRSPRFSSFCSSSSMAGADADAPAASSSVEKQFVDFRAQLEDSGSLRDRIRSVAMEIESSTRLMQASLLLVHQSRLAPEVLEKPKVQVGLLKSLYKRLAEILRESPGLYYRYHGDWRSETQTAVSLLAFIHWLETGELLLHPEAEEKLGLNESDFTLDVEDYLIGICFMSNELPRYVVNQVTVGDYDCPRKVLKFFTDLHAAFRMLNLRNDFLRKKFDGMKYDLRRVEEVYYDVKIRGLSATRD
ncbi:translin [Cucurbita pepo subsp. pepo]|uniref:translin n=1 Tax=Cucurbita pepo subsp. pepo TaxID=3664 RepID=UPI000C9D4D19|nr:translin [Cucurbita pepo subsp. pepo]